jgi:O-antigen ligase
LNLIFLIAGGAFFIYALVYKPEIIAVILFTLVIGEINIFNLRPIVTLALFGRIIVDKAMDARYPAFLRIPNVKLLIVFLVYGMMVSFAQGLLNYDLFKGDLDTVMLTFCMYYFFFKHRNANQLKAALIVSGVICFADLAYTYIVYGSFPIHRIYYLLTGGSENISEENLDAMANWNYFGEICGMSFIYILSDYIRDRHPNKLLIWLLPVMFVGVFMSTSRSAILALLVIIILIILKGINYREHKKRLAKIGVLVAGTALIGLLMTATLGNLINLDSKFIDDITSRLTQEPLAIIQKAMGQSYNVNNLGSMDWREESAENAYNAYMNMPFMEQLFGIGVHGFEVRDIGHGYNAHNALLLLLIENGIIGAVLYFVIVIGIIIQSISRSNFSPSVYVVGFILIYGVGQNREWTGWTSFLFIYCIVAEIQLIKVKKRENLNSLSPGKANLTLKHSP